MGACQACIQAPTEQNAEQVKQAPPIKVNGAQKRQTTQPRVLRPTPQKESPQNSDDVNRKPVQKAKDGGKKKILNSKTAQTIDFDKHFPKLMESLGNLEKLTDFQGIKLSLKFASDEELSHGTRSFYNSKMAPFLEAIDSEVTSVLGDFWTNMKSQSQQLFAIHSILVLWTAIKDPLFQELSSSH